VNRCDEREGIARDACARADERADVAARARTNARSLLSDVGDAVAGGTASRRSRGTRAARWRAGRVRIGGGKIFVAPARVIEAAARRRSRARARAGIPMRIVGDRRKRGVDPSRARARASNARARTERTGGTRVEFHARRARGARAPFRTRVRARARDGPTRSTLARHTSGVRGLGESGLAGSRRGAVTSGVRASSLCFESGLVEMRRGWWRATRRRLRRLGECTWTDPFVPHVFIAYRRLASPPRRSPPRRSKLSPAASRAKPPPRRRAPRRSRP